MASDNRKETERTELHRTILNIANDLGNSVDGWDFKKYVLGILFYRCISENLPDYIETNEHAKGDTSFRYRDQSDDDAESVKDEMVNGKRLFILPGELFSNASENATSEENINETLEKVSKHIEGSAMGTGSERGPFSSSLKGKVDVTSDEIERFNAAKGGDFLPRTSGTRGEIGMAGIITEDVGNCVANGFVLRARTITPPLLPEYCSYCFSTKSFREEIVRYSSYTIRALTNGTTLSMSTMTIPPLDEQIRMVDILDRFESLCNDLSLGLPAEMTACQKQYGCCRDKLLSFEGVES